MPNSRASANTTPPLAVPSSLVTTRPVTFTASLNWRSCEIAFWPVVPSITISTSCGASGSSLPSTRRILPSSAIRPRCVCRRPAVSAMSTSTPRAFAACSASNATEAASASWPCATTATPLRAPQARSCATAAARKVSPAASISAWPSSRNRRASFPIVVVLPTPLTPTVRITNGLRPASTCSGRATGRSIATRSLRSAASSALASANSRAFIRLRKSSIKAVVAGTPTSAVSSAVSMSSSRSSSRTGFRPNSSADVAGQDAADALPPAGFPGAAAAGALPHLRGRGRMIRACYGGTNSPWQRNRGEWANLTIRLGGRFRRTMRFRLIYIASRSFHFGYMAKAAGMPGLAIRGRSPAISTQSARCSQA